MSSVLGPIRAAVPRILAGLSRSPLAITIVVAPASCRHQTSVWSVDEPQSQTEERNGRFGLAAIVTKCLDGQDDGDQRYRIPVVRHVDREILLADKLPGHVCFDRPGAENLVALSRKISDSCCHLASGSVNA